MLKDLLQTIKQLLLQEGWVLLLAVVWLPARLLLAVERSLKNGNQVNLKVNGKKVLSLQVEGLQGEEETEKAEKQALNEFTQLKQDSPILYSQAVKPALLKKARREQAEKGKEEDIKWQS